MDCDWPDGAKRRRRDGWVHEQVDGVDGVDINLESPRPGSIVGETHRRRFQALTRFLTKRRDCASTASDIAQSAFVVLAENEHKGEIRDPERYVFCVALNLASTHGKETGAGANCSADRNRRAISFRYCRGDIPYWNGPGAIGWKI